LRSIRLGSWVGGGELEEIEEAEEESNELTRHFEDVC